ncbi:MAG TPA: hypothetical protein PKD28_03425 [Candidatus Saccharibacteria bacterium]|nr:hypothetical protein [Candidatus Saccharibacteria bacterium]
MGKNTTKKQPTPTTPQAVLEEAVEVSAEIKAAADFTDLGAAVDYAMTITDTATREAYFANLKPLRDITAFDFFSRVKKPLTELQAATATGNKAAANKAAAKVTDGLEAFAEISPEFRTYVKGLDDRITALESKDTAQDKRLDRLEARQDKIEARQDKIEVCLAAITRGEQVKPFVPHKEQKATPTPTKPIPVPPKPEAPVTDAESLARAAGASYEAPDQKVGPLRGILNVFKLGSGKDSDLPAQGKYWSEASPKEKSSTDTNNAASGTHGKE